MAIAEIPQDEAIERPTITEVFEGIRRREAAAFALVRPALMSALLETADAPEPVDVIEMVAERTGVADETLIQNALMYLPGVVWAGDRFRVMDQPSMDEPVHPQE